MDYFVMDNVYANPQTKIDNSIAPKLSQCDAHMLTVVEGLLDNLLTYQEKKEQQIKKELQEQDEWCEQSKHGVVGDSWQSCAI